MFKINENKLTDYDRQILTMLAMDASRWSIHPEGLNHAEFGKFKRSLYGFGMQHESQAMHQGGYAQWRQLSWRGQVLLRKQYRQLVSSCVKTKEEPQTIAPAFVLGGGVITQQGQARAAREKLMEAHERLVKGNVITKTE